MATLVVADLGEGGKVLPSTLSTVTFATQLESSSDGGVHVLVAGEGDDVTQAAAQEAARVDGVSKVLRVTDAAYGHRVAENMSKLVGELQGERSYGAIVASSLTGGKNFVPRLAADLDVMPITDVVETTDGKETFKRPVYAGNAIATVRSLDAVKLLTARPTAFDKAVVGDAPQAEVEDVTVAEPDAGFAQWVSDDFTKSDRPDLTSAGTVVSGGRGMKNGENFAMLEELADVFGGAVGASRAAVDAGFVPNDMQVGQTGKVVAPELYIAVGISGAIQHLAGMKDSKTIVAINKDPDAPIFQVADVGLVADLFKAVPEFVEKAKAAKN